MRITDLPDDLLRHIFENLVSQVSSGDLDSEYEGFRPSDLWRKRTWHSGTLLGPVRLTCKELRNKVDSMVTKLSVDPADIPLDQLHRPLQVLLAVCR